VPLGANALSHLSIPFSHRRQRLLPDIAHMIDVIKRAEDRIKDLQLETLRLNKFLEARVVKAKDLELALFETNIFGRYTLKWPGGSNLPWNNNQRILTFLLFFFAVALLPNL
jgi:hypothetical protein